MSQPDENVRFQNRKWESGRKTQQGSSLIELIDVQVVLSWPSRSRLLVEASDGWKLGRLNHEVPFARTRLRLLWYQLESPRKYSDSDVVVDMFGWPQLVVFVLSTHCDAAETTGTGKHTFQSNSDVIVDKVRWLQLVVFVLSARCDAAEAAGTGKHTFHFLCEHNYCKDLLYCI